MSTAAEDEWVTVGRSKSGRSKATKQRRGRNKKTHASFYGAGTQDDAKSEDGCKVSLKDLSLQIIRCAACLGRSGYIPRLLSAVRSVKSNDDVNEGIGEIVCYGIGNFSEPYSPSMLQLACVLQVRRELAAITEVFIEEEATDEMALDVFRKKSEVDVFYFEPEILSVERKILEEFNVEIIETNEQGKRRTSKNSCGTLFYMPHCPMRLYSNVLWANWDPDILFRGKLVIFGNDFCAYDERTVRREERSDPSNCVLQILPFAHSIKLKVFEGKKRRNGHVMALDDEVLVHIERAFSDTTITWFNGNGRNQSPMVFPRRPAEYFKNEHDCELL